MKKINLFQINKKPKALESLTGNNSSDDQVVLEKTEALALRENFWEEKKLSELNETEWELLCDNCGKCCFNKILEGHGKHKRYYFTRVACDLLNTNTCKCTNYEDRFILQKHCIKLTAAKAKTFTWLPETCAYRLLSENKPLPTWHPLIHGDTSLVPKIQNGVHESDVSDLYDYIIDDQ